MTKVKWARWVGEKILVPVIVAALAACGAVVGAEETSNAPSCEPKVVVTDTVTKAPGRRTSISETTQRTTCPRR